VLLPDHRRDASHGEQQRFDHHASRRRTLPRLPFARRTGRA
jgi:hypothetical protein